MLVVMLTVFRGPDSAVFMGDPLGPEGLTPTVTFIWDAAC
jgi:hypothetical protein